MCALLMFVRVLSFGVLMLTAIGGYSPSMAYDCNRRDGEDCHAIFSFGAGCNGGATCVYGFATTVDIVSLINGESTTTNEMWLVPLALSGGAWIEAGYGTFALHNFEEGMHRGNLYFWAEKDPSTGTETDHFFGQQLPDDIGRQATISIHLLDHSDGLHFAVSIAISGTLRIYNAIAVSSMWSPLGYGAVDVGQELRGTSGASSPYTRFTNNQWMDRENRMHLLTAAAPSSQDAPPYFRWTPRPPNTGELAFVTNCCTAPPRPQRIAGNRTIKLVNAEGIPAATEPTGVPALKIGSSSPSEPARTVAIASLANDLKIPRLKVNFRQHAPVSVRLWFDRKRPLRDTQERSYRDWARS